MWCLLQVRVHEIDQGIPDCLNWSSTVCDRVSKPTYFCVTGDDPNYDDKFMRIQQVMEAGYSKLHDCALPGAWWWSLTRGTPLPCRPGHMRYTASHAAVCVPTYWHDGHDVGGTGRRTASTPRLI